MSAMNCVTRWNVWTSCRYAGDTVSDCGAGAEVGPNGSVDAAGLL